MRYISFILSGILLFSQTVFADEKRVLMLISSYGTEANPELSYDLEELAQSYLVLHDNGVQLDIASPKGGAVLVKNNKDSLAYIQRFKTLAAAKLAQTLATGDIDVTQYNGVFIVGGAGAMLDLPTHKETQALLTSAAINDQVIAAVCHGPAAIANIKLPDGSYFVADKQVNGFTNSEEHAFSGEHLSQFPFLLQDRLIQNGARFVHNAPMLPYVAVDGNLITAQNPGSVAKAAEAMVLALGLPVNKRQLFSDESTMELLSKARQNGPIVIDLALQRRDHNIDINYLALYGFYAYRLADEADKARELAIMHAISKHFSHPEYDAQLILQSLEQGQLERASAVYAQFVERYPEHNYVSELKAKLTE
ncbi:type 1 glutamine amidotransferase domain-containing protein [Bowmanella sp. Y26]|uniref:type 1 glutamine amidotransferase domain-containing protein n=1 Tax=Bowmanella yangjiangensis TaxID=2811230 RepID=UPI001BDCCF24|nr:type 1 glutamine amidotransferase domain-containing protein [Bowmanella yangjiangensis]MBT1064368.1 type 1 glutamine amidotransferase domain-containing protein [Bowmanella yangjiangensis]